MVLFHLTVTSFELFTTKEMALLSMVFAYTGRVFPDTRLTSITFSFRAQVCWSCGLQVWSSPSSVVSMRRAWVMLSSHKQRVWRAWVEYLSASEKLQARLTLTLVKLNINYCENHLRWFVVRNSWEEDHQVRTWPGCTAWLSRAHRQLLLGFPQPVLRLPIHTQGRSCVPTHVHHAKVTGNELPCSGTVLREHTILFFFFQ